MKYAACVFVVNDKNEILGVSRKDDHTAWGLPGGKANKDETIVEAAIREAKEETGLDVYDLRLIYVRGKEHPDGHETFTFSAKYNADQKLGSLNPNETGKVAWITKKELLSGPFGEYNKKLLNHINWKF